MQQYRIKILYLYLLQELTPNNSLVFTLTLYQQVTVQAKQITDKVNFFHYFVYFIILLGYGLSDYTYSKL